MNQKPESGASLVRRVLLADQPREAGPSTPREAAVLAEAGKRGFLVTPRGASAATERRLVLAWGAECRRQARPFVCARQARRWAWISLDLLGHRLTRTGLDLVGRVLRGASVRRTVLTTPSGGGTWVPVEDAEVVSAMLLDIALEQQTAE